MYASIGNPLLHLTQGSRAKAEIRFGLILGLILCSAHSVLPRVQECCKRKMLWRPEGLEPAGEISVFD